MRTLRPKDLPDFERPPVTETVLSLQFEPLPALNSVQIGRLWERYRSDFPYVEEHPPLEHVVERFDRGGQDPIRVTIEDRPLPLRVWFLDATKTQLIQVQTDRFIHNWRKVTGEEEYPHYDEVIRPAFKRQVERLEEFLKGQDLGTLKIDQCEITYINHIEQSGVWQQHGELESVFKNWSKRPMAFLPDPEDAAAHIRYLIRHNGEVAGRFHATLQAGWKTKDDSPVFIMNLTARGKPLNPQQQSGLDGAFSFFDLGRQWIVKGFKDLTTESMHHAWRIVHADT